MSSFFRLKSGFIVNLDMIVGLHPEKNMVLFGDSHIQVEADEMKQIINIVLPTKKKGGATGQ